MKKSQVIFLFLTFIFSSINAQDSLEVITKKANVYIIRDKFTNVINALNKFDFYNNDKYIGSLKGYNYLKYECDAGKQLFWTAAENQDFLEIDLKPNETYIIEANYKIGIMNGRVKLKLVSTGSDNYFILKKKILSKEPIEFTINQLDKKNIKRRSFIIKSLKKYNSEKKRELSFKNDSIPSSLAITSKINNGSDILSPIVLDYNAVDFPYSNKSIEISGLKGLIMNPSMSQSLNIASSVNSLTREGLYRLMTKNLSVKPYYILSAGALDILSYLPIPLTSGWMHEEFHRAVMAKHGGNSYNEMNDFPIFKSLISVMNVKDEDLIQLKLESPQDMVRMSEAGIEGQYLMSNNINKAAFFYETKSISFTPFYSTLNSIVYVIMCSGKNIDRATNALNTTEGSSIVKRDLLGLDFLSYTYDLFRPNEPYQNRGIHPSGVGVDRYIKLSQLTTDEKSYLKQQGFLQLINIVNPITFMLNSFTIKKNDNGDHTRANIYFNHWLTSFGYDISTTGLLHYNKNNYAFTFHNYVNHANWMPGIELETYDYLFGKNIIKKPIPVTARVMAWLQPENQLFFSKVPLIGGLIEAKIQYPLSKYFNPYISVTVKTNGWVAGNVYLERNISSSFGLRASF